MKYLITILFALIAGPSWATYCSLESPQYCPAQPAQQAPTATATSSAAPSISSAAAGAMSSSGASATGQGGNATGTGTGGSASMQDSSRTYVAPAPVYATPLPSIRCRSTSRAGALGWSFMSGAGADSDVDGICQAADLAAMLIAQCQHQTAHAILAGAMQQAYPNANIQIPAAAKNSPTGRCEPTPAPVAPIVKPDPVPAPKPERIALQAGALFDRDSSELRPEGMAELARLAQRLDAQQINVIGHASSEGGSAHNDALSQRRASAVRAYLIMRGIDMAAISSEGRGSREPVADNSTEHGRVLNRRVVIEEGGVAR